LTLDLLLKNIESAFGGLTFKIHRITRKRISLTGDTSPFAMYNSEGRLGQSGDGEASLFLLFFSGKI
jgi:hypothetical protein